MQSSTILSLNVQTPNYATVMHAVQFDKLSRKITAYLFDGAAPFIPPEGALAMVRYSKPDGTMGFYDTLEDGETAAVTWEGNTATVWLAEQVLTVAGNALCQIQFFTSTERLSTFTFVIGVEANAVSDESIESTDYFSILTQRIEAILGAVAYPPSINAQGHWMLFDTETQQYYDSGVDATGPQGPTGPTGPYMASIAKISGTGAPGTTDQYQVTLSDGTHPTGTISVYNGEDGQGAPGSATPLMDGTASAGSANAYSREDHIHPSDSSKVNTSDYFVGTSTSFSGLKYISAYGYLIIRGFFTGNGTSEVNLGIPDTGRMGLAVCRNSSTGTFGNYYINSNKIDGWDGSTSRTFENNVSYLMIAIV